jgi:hypothetical protein
MAQTVWKVTFAPVENQAPGEYYVLDPDIGGAARKAWRIDAVASATTAEHDGRWRMTIEKVAPVAEEPEP